VVGVAPEAVADTGAAEVAADMREAAATREAAGTQEAVDMRAAGMRVGHTMGTTRHRCCLRPLLPIIRVGLPSGIARTIMIAVRFLASVSRLDAPQPCLRRSRQRSDSDRAC
jgi:hypothetical protein